MNIFMQPHVFERSCSRLLLFLGNASHLSTKAAAFVLAWVLLATPLLAADVDTNWTRFRGPNGSGISSVTGLPSEWTDKDYRWTLSLPGVGHASPVVINGRVFAMCGDKATAKRTLVCVDSREGRLLWERSFESSTFQKNRDNSYASSTPAVDAQRVYVYWTTAEEVTVLAFDFSGKEVWRRNLGPYKSQHGSGASPMLVNGLVIVNNDQEGPSSLMALDAQTGSTRWEIKRRQDRAAYSTPLIRPGPDGQPEIIFTSSGHGVTAADPRSGTVLWQLTNAFPFRVVGSPILADNLIVGACGEGGIGRRVVAVRPPVGNEPPALAYEMKNSIPYVPTPLYRAGLLFLWGDNGLVTCHRAATGERIWQRKISDSFYGSPVCAEDRLYCVSKKGNVYVLSATENDRLIATVALGEASFATPAIAEGAMFFRTESRLLCLPASSGKF